VLIHERDPHEHLNSPSHQLKMTYLTADRERTPTANFRTGSVTDVDL
jgi:hypothetical protein